MNKKQHLFSLARWLCWFWLTALVCGLTVQGLPAAWQGSPVPNARLSALRRVAKRKESYDLALKYLNGLAASALQLQHLPLEGGGETLQTLLLVADQLSPELTVERISPEGRWIIIEGQSAQNASARLYLQLRGEKHFERVEYESSAGAEFVIRCLRRER